MNLPASPEIRALRYNPTLKPWDYIPGLVYKPGKVFAAIRLRGPRIWDWLIPVLLMMGSMAIILLSGMIVNQTLRETPITWDFFEMVLFGIVSIVTVPILSGIVLFAACQILGATRIRMRESLSIIGTWEYVLLIALVMKLSLQVFFGISYSSNPADWFGVGSNLFFDLTLSVFQPTTLYYLFIVGVGVLLLGRVSKKRVAVIQVGMMLVTAVVYLFERLPMIMFDVMTWIIDS